MKILIVSYIYIVDFNWEKLCVLVKFEFGFEVMVVVF